MKFYYIHQNCSGIIFVKTEAFFIEQSGLSQKWGRCWQKIEAKSIEDARKKGERLLKSIKLFV